MSAPAEARRGDLDGAALNACEDHVARPGLESFCLARDDRLDLVDVRLRQNSSGKE